ncbi:exonuclease SbcCD subunit D [Candidatus Daviesbacteria bacterium]|nr:exonuclease SbcCD subunit D [Candidatus Daviesbacteria bacterium]
MKLLHFSDLHIGMENYAKLDPETGLSTRLLDFFSTFDFIIEKAFAENVDAVVFAGDAYKTRDPNPTQQRGFGERVAKLAKKIPVILIVGNHDTPNAEGKANTLDIYSALEITNVWVSRKPELLNIPTKSGSLQVITLPWLHKNDYKTVAEKLKLLYEKIKPDSPAILASHAEIEGASFGSEKGLAIANDVTLPLPLFQDKRLSYVALGHIHKHQILSKDPPVIYSGSPQRIDFGEEKEEKGICLVEITPLSLRDHEVAKQSSSVKISTQIASSSFDKLRTPRNDTFNTTSRFIPTNARQFLTISIDLKSDDENPSQTILKEIEKNDVKDKIVRVIINIPKECDKEIQMDKIKKTLSSANFIAGISRNVERVERIKFDGNTEVESLTPVEALKKYFEFKKYAPEKQKELEKYAASLLES